MGLRLSSPIWSAASRTVELPKPAPPPGNFCLLSWILSFSSQSLGTFEKINSKANPRSKEAYPICADFYPMMCCLPPNSLAKAFIIGLGTNRPVEKTPHSFQQKVRICPCLSRMGLSCREVCANFLIKRS